MKKIVFCLIALLTFFKSHTENSLHDYNALTIRATSKKQHKKNEDINEIIFQIHSKNLVPAESFFKVQDTQFLLSRGITILKQDKYVFIFSRGYAKTNTFGTNDNFLQRGACAKGAYVLLRDNIDINGPLVSFDYDDSRTGFSFGQENEIKILRQIYQKIVAQNCNAQIILIGDCRGAKVALELASERPANLKALILLAPFTKASDLTNRIAESHISYLPKSKTLLHYFFRFYFSSYDTKKDSLESRLDKINNQVPIFIGHKKSDTLISMQTIYNLVHRLKKHGHAVQLCLIDDPTHPHSRLTENKTMQMAVNKFISQLCYA